MRGGNVASVAAKRYTYIFLALVFAAVAAMGTYQVLTAHPAARSVTVYVAKSTIAARTAISPTDVEKRIFPMAGYPDATAAPVGKVTMVGVVPGEVIVNGMLAQGAVSGGLSAQVPAGMYAMSIPVNQITGVNGAIQPGDRVDLVAGGAGGAKDIMPKVLVLEKTASVLTLEVSQEAALTIVKAQEHGTLTVILRGIAHD